MAFYILPSSFVLPPTSLKSENTPFAGGGFGDVYKATFNGSPVVIKTLKVRAQIDLKKLHGVTGLNFKGIEAIADWLLSS